MGSRFTAPQTIFEWQILVASLFILYLVIGFVATRDLLYAISLGLYGGIGMTVVLAILVFTWRGVRDTFVRQES